jgi:hypothetical protein
MKKIIFIFALLVSTYSYSQTLKWVNFISFEFQNSTCELGDSALVTIKYSNNMVGEDTLVFALQHVYPDNSVSGLFTVCKIGFIPFIHNIPLDVNGNKSFKIKLPESYTLGNTRILTTSQPTQALNRPSFVLEQNVVAGISQQYFDQENAEIIYFDQLGNKIEKPNEGLYLWIDNKGRSGKIFMY